MTAFYLGIFAASVLLSFFLTRYVRNLANARGWLAAPALERHLHQVPLPRIGGVAIYSAFILTVGIARLISWRYPDLDFRFSPKVLVSILLPATLIFLLGVYDDLRGVGPYTKFAVQALAGGIVFAYGLRVLDIPVLFGGHRFPWFVSLPLTILWVIAITNAFNLIDGLDGLAAGSALFSTLVVFVVALLSGSVLVSLLSLAMVGAILGFLRFNFNPATIFLGDSGSLFIGFMLSALALRGTQKAPTVVAIAIPVVSFGLPILETTLSVIRRFISGRPVFTADREHVHPAFAVGDVAWPGCGCALWCVWNFFYFKSFSSLANRQHFRISVGCPWHGHLGWSTASWLPGIWRIAASCSANHGAAADFCE